MKILLTLKRINQRVGQISSPLTLMSLVTFDLSINAIGDYCFSGISALGLGGVSVC